MGQEGIFQCRWEIALRTLQVLASGSSRKTIGRRSRNAMHSWVPGYTFSQRSYIDVTSPLRMHIKISPIQRNGCCGLSYVRNLILTTYLPDIYSVYCWSHGIVQFAVIEARGIHLIYELDCIFSFFCQIFANRVFNYEFNL